MLQWLTNDIHVYIHDLSLDSFQFSAKLEFKIRVAAIQFLTWVKLLIG